MLLENINRPLEIIVSSALFKILNYTIYIDFFFPENIRIVKENANYGQVKNKFIKVLTL